MFYSHEVLTSRKYGVATVWLVATLGSKSTLKKINRKAILDVDVPKACQTIVDPGAPMALRLQGNLLYGLSRVYLQQCGYILLDAEKAHQAMRMMLKVVKDAALDPEAGKARPENLVLQDDPSFLPDFALPPPELLADLNLPPPQAIPRTGESQSLTPFASQQRLIHGTPEAPIGGLIIPTSSSVGPGDFWIHGDDGVGSIGVPLEETREGTGATLLDQEYSFDDDGNMVEFLAGSVVAGAHATRRGSDMISDAGARARVRAEHEEGQRQLVQAYDNEMDLDLPFLADEVIDGEAFSPHAGRPLDQSGIIESSSAVSAPMRRRQRAPKVIPFDTNMELRNKDLADWNKNYSANMREASRIKRMQRAAAQAKKNAEHWVWGAGIGGIGNQSLGGMNPFDRLYGDNLFKLFTGLNRKTFLGTKRDRDSGIDDDTQAEARRVRQRSEEEEVGRGRDDEGLFLPDDEVELPRDAPSALDDHQIFSAMPWNMSASARGSSVVPRSGTGPPGSLGHRGGRMVSASPLHGRGQPGGLSALGRLQGDDDFGDIGPDDFGMAPSSDTADFDPAIVNEPSNRVHEALSAEGENFLTFVSDAIAEKEVKGDADDSQPGEVLFEELLPPAECSRMIACQGLMMVLALGTRGMLNVRQDGDFEEIGLSLTENAMLAEAQRIAETEAENNKDQGEESRAHDADSDTKGEASGHDEQDSLYDD